MKFRAIMLYSRGYSSVAGDYDLSQLRPAVVDAFRREFETPRTAFSAHLPDHLSGDVSFTWREWGQGAAVAELLLDGCIPSTSLLVHVGGALDHALIRFEGHLLLVSHGRCTLPLHGRYADSRTPLSLSVLWVNSGLDGDRLADASELQQCLAAAAFEHDADQTVAQRRKWSPRAIHGGMLSLFTRESLFARGGKELRPHE